jgi:Xaa-Pro aminopeptidase
VTASLTPLEARAARRRRLAGSLLDRGLDAIVLTRGSDLRWAAGFTGSAGAFLVRSNGDSMFATDARYAPAISDLLPDGRLLTSREPCRDLVAQALSEGAESVGLDPQAISWDQGRQLVTEFTSERIVDAGGVMNDLRAVKDPVELAAIREACRITEAAITALITTMTPGESERAIAHRFLRLIDDLGADGPAFDPIVASGPNAAVPHHEPGSRTLAPGDLVILDLGARFEGYCADVSRTFAIGAPDPVLRQVHAVVLDAQAAGRGAVRAGASAAAVDAVARAVIEAAGHGLRFVHGTGHGLGLDIHEPPILREGSAGILRESFVVTVEPGVYLPGLGGVRIEDTVIVGAEGAESLTLLPRELIVL